MLAPDQRMGATVVNGLTPTPQAIAKAPASPTPCLPFPRPPGPTRTTARSATPVSDGPAAGENWTVQQINAAMSRSDWSSTVIVLACTTRLARMDRDRARDAA